MRRTALLFVVLGASCSGIIEAPSPTDSTDATDARESPGSSPGAHGAPAPAPPQTGEIPPEGPGPVVRCEAPSEAPDPGVPFSRRLTRAQIVGGLEDAFGVDLTAAAEMLPADLRADGFTNQSSSLVVSYEHVQALWALAEATVAAVDDWHGFVRDRADCVRVEQRCQRSFVRALGEDLFRRPLTDEQVARYDAVYEAAADEDADFFEAAEFVAHALIQSPEFLYRMERAVGDDGIRTLDGYELATRLSFLVTGAAPDADLLAEVDRLHEPATIAAQTQRLLGTTAARERSRVFLEDWLGLEALENKSSVLDPLSGPLVEGILEEPWALFEALIWEEGRPMMELYSARKTIANGPLAEHYGLEPSGSAPREYDLSPLSERAGLLTQPAVLIAHAFGEEPSLVRRAEFILYDVLCGSIPPPPPSAPAALPPLEAGKTQRTYSEQRIASADCSACHQALDPLGYAFVPFDAAGRFRTEDEFGNPLPSDGVYETEDRETITFANASDLAQGLAESRTARWCLASKQLQFALGRSIEGQDACTIVDVEERWLADGGTYGALIEAVATHPAFRTIRTEAN